MGFAGPSIDKWPKNKLSNYTIFTVNRQRFQLSNTISSSIGLKIPK